MAKKEEYQYSPELETCIVDACQYCIDNTFGADDEKQLHPIMMHGMIQSGKTRAFTGLIALAFDNNFDMVFILTKNSKALVQQTEARMKKEFKPFIIENEIVVKNIINMSYNLTGYQLEKKLIVIAKKQQDNLDKLIEFIDKYSITQNKRTIIIDDEADTTGIGYEKVKGADEYDLRTVASKVNDIRGNLDGCVFVQVTATPYALYLQPEFKETEKPMPIKPRQTVLVPPGKGYVGGNYYFIDSQNDDSPARFLFHPVGAEEHEIVSIQKRKGKKSKINDRRTFKEEEILISENALPVFKRGIINFFIGAIVLREINKKHYAYVIHTATQKGSHNSLKSVTETLLGQIKNRNDITMPKIKKLLMASYDDIKQSVLAYGFNMPEYSTVCSKFFEAIDKEYYRVDVVNSDNDVYDLLDEDSGELQLANPFSIFVGGQVLDRGVTISNLIGFYYGRNPVTMQQDTVLQHSRMFGYRNEELLSVTRFYTTERLHSNMEKITEIDNELREEISKGALGNGVYFITQKKQDDKFGKNGRIIPCSPSKIRVSDVIFLKPYGRTLPVGFTPISKTIAEQVDKKLCAYFKENGITEQSDGYNISISDVENLIKLVYEVIKKDEDSTRFVGEDEFITTLRYLVGENQHIPIIIRTNRNLPKRRPSGRIYDNPDTSGGQPDFAKKYALDLPVIMFLRHSGKSEGWYERPFWWPVLMAPKNIHKTMYASKLPAEKIYDQKPEYATV